jgi:HlyD family secretion protein
MSENKPAEGGTEGMSSTLITLVVAGLFAFGVTAYVNTRHPSPLPVSQAKAPEAPAAGMTTGSTTHAPSNAVAQAPVKSDAKPGHSALPPAQWAASATGRIEPKDGELRLATPVGGRIVDVLVKANQRVGKGALLVRLDDEDALLKVAAANSETDVRKRERDEEQASPIQLERRKAEDAVADAERVLFKARLAYDAAVIDLRNGKGSDDDAKAARVKITQAEERVGQERGALARVNLKPNMPLPTRLESSLQVSRADTSAAEALVDKLRLRAPHDGTVLTVPAKVGELAQPSPEAPLVSFGDLASLRVRAEVEERDATKVRAGQKIVVRADAYPGQEFAGEVTSVAQSLSPPRINARGPRRPNDVEVLEVLAALDGNPPLLTGMRVDVYFKTDKSADAATGVKR